jgi:hypothetical protein
MTDEKIFETDDDGRTKTVGHRGRNVRISRTGGAGLREQTKAGGVTFTGSTSEGLRATVNAGKGTQVSSQNGRTIIRGRYKVGKSSHVNMSKSGFSMSTRFSAGTVNWLAPGRSSATVCGVTIRGSKAIPFALLSSLWSS